MTTLKAYMDKRGISQTEMARMLGVRQPSVNRYRKGQVPDPKVMQRLIDLTGAKSPPTTFSSCRKGKGLRHDRPHDIPPDEARFHNCRRCGSRAERIMTMTYNTTQQQPAQQQHGSVAGLVVLGVLVLSSRLRNGLGFLAAAAVVLGGVVAVVATLLGQPDVANIGGGIMVAGAVAVGLWMVASALAWLLRIVAEDVRRDYFDDERNVS